MGIKILTQKTIIGSITIMEQEGLITKLYFPEDKVNLELENEKSDILLRAFEQLNQYLAGKLYQFNIPLNPKGSSFYLSVWTKLLDIPYGNVSTYKELALNINSPKAARAVGGACHNNPIPIFIPCHRIIGSSGQYVGYRGGLSLKKWLLNLEKTNNPL